MKLALTAFPLSMSFAFSDLPPIDFTFKEDRQHTHSKISLSKQQQQNAFTYHSYIKPFVGSVKQHTNSALYQFLINELKSHQPMTVEFLNIDIHARKMASFSDTYEIVCQSRAKLEQWVSTTLYSYTSHSANISEHAMPCFERISQEIQMKIDTIS
ncbi:hypothetical protein JCM19240_2585 [Vibrio maritimus]|uniref:Uncharacterized protein n=1 Tax=Vibrio maritimus TaxID=990268 RepID=A0A090T9D6_9VIBR|nr:hypothetical protein JCM19240_2585 [Vibrio maritimus]